MESDIIRGDGNAEYEAKLVEVLPTIASVSDKMLRAMGLI